MKNALTIASRITALPSSMLLPIALLAFAAAGCPSSGRKTNVTSCQVDTECSAGLCIQSQCEPGDGDKDDDGLPNLVEKELGTDPTRADTDGDGVDDLTELGGDRAHPLDTDQDGLIDALESTLLDSDHDCLSDQEDADETSAAERRALAHCPSEGRCADAPEGSFQVTCERAPDGSPQAGEVTWSCAVVPFEGYEADETLCDGQDNDCDGQTDERGDGEPMTCCQEDADCAELAVPPSCPDPTNSCQGSETVATCEIQTHACLTQTQPAPAACAGEPCSEATCSADGASFRPAGTCSAQGTCDTPAPESCDDSDACTDDVCDSATGCIHEAVSCDDGDACTDDVCDSATGCTHEAVSCDDGDACTDDVCDSATGCTHEAVSCDDGDACTDDVCNSATGCIHEAVSCDDGDACTDDVCDSATGCTHEAVSCDDGDACTDDVCDSATGCIHEAVSCDDGDACTDDVCDSATGCAHTPAVCDPISPCGEEGTCVEGECVYPEVVCDDGDPCTNNLCIEGVCQNPALSCSDDNSCTVDACDPQTGSCTFTPGDDGVACDDGDPCTANDVCVAGQCVGVAVVGPTGLSSLDATLGMVDAVHGVAPIPLPDGSPGYALAGEAWSLDGQPQNPDQGWVGVVDADGQQLWALGLGGPGDDGLQGVAALPGGGFVAVGTYAAPGSQRDDLWVLGVAPTGDAATPYAVQGRRLFDSGGDDAAFAVAPLPASAGGGFVVAGRAGGANGGLSMKDGWLLRFDDQGRDLWRETFGGPGDDELLAVAVGDDGLIYAAGTSSPGAGAAPAAPSPQDADAWLLVVDAHGQLVRERRWDVGGGWEDEALAVVPVFSAPNGEPRGEGVLLAGRTRAPSGSQRAWAARLDAFGALAWDLFVPETGALDTDTAFYGAAADAGGFVLVGAQGVASLTVGVDSLGNQRWMRSVPTVGPLTSLAARPADLGWVAGASAEAEAVQLVRLDAWGHGTCEDAGACVTKTVSVCADDNPCVVPACEPYSDPGTGDPCTADMKGPAAPCPGSDACHPVGACDDGGNCVDAPRLFSWTGTEAMVPAVADLVPRRRGGLALLGDLADPGGANARAHAWYLGPDGFYEGGNEPYVAPDTWTSHVTAATRVYDGRLVVVGAQTDGGQTSSDGFIQWLKPDGGPVAGLAYTYPGQPGLWAQWLDVAASEDGRTVAAVGSEGYPTTTPIFQTWDARGNPIVPNPVYVGAGGMLDTLDAIAPFGDSGWVAAGQTDTVGDGIVSARVAWFDLQGNGVGEVTFEDPQDPLMAALLPRDLLTLPDGRVLVVGERQSGTAALPESFLAVVSGPGGVVSNLTILDGNDGNPALERVAQGPLGLVAVGHTVVGFDLVVVGFNLNPDVVASASPVVRSWTWTPPGASPVVLGPLAARVLPGGDLLMAGTVGAAPQPFAARLDPWGNGASCSTAGSCGLTDVRACDGPVDGDPCTTSYCDASAGGCLANVSQPDATCSGSSCTSAGLCSDPGGCGAPIACNDGDPLTLDACVEGVGCVFTPYPDWSEQCQAGLSQPDVMPDCDGDGVADVCTDVAHGGAPVAPGVWRRGDDLTQPFGDPGVEDRLAFASPASVAFVAHGEERGVELRMEEPFGDGTDTWGPSLPGSYDFLGVSVYAAWQAAAGAPADDGASEGWTAGLGERLELHYSLGTQPFGGFQRWDGQTWAYQDATVSVDVAGDRVRITGMGAGPSPCAPFLVVVVVEVMDTSAGAYQKLVKVVGASDTGELVTAYPYTQLIAP